MWLCSASPSSALLLSWLWPTSSPCLCMSSYIWWNGHPRRLLIKEWLCYWHVENRWTMDSSSPLPAVLSIFPIVLCFPASFYTMQPAAPILVNTLHGSAFCCLSCPNSIGFVPLASNKYGGMELGKNLKQNTVTVFPSPCCLLYVESLRTKLSYTP